MSCKIEGAVAAGGKPWYIRCQICGNYDSPHSVDMWINGTATIGQHRSCARLYQQRRRNASKSA